MDTDSATTHPAFDTIPHNFTGDAINRINRLLRNHRRHRLNGGFEEALIRIRNILDHADEGTEARERAVDAYDAIVDAREAHPMDRDEVGRRLNEALNNLTADDS